MFCCKNNESRSLKFDIVWNVIIVALFSIACFIINGFDWGVKNSILLAVFSAFLFVKTLFIRIKSKNNIE